MNVMALLLADSRFPGGGHAHSGGLEEAAARGLVRTEADLPAFLRNRLRTAGALAAVFAAAAARPGVDWLVLDAELDARTPSAAQRAASRAQGKATARAAKAMLAAAPLAREPHSLACPGEVERESRSFGQPGEAGRESGSFRVSREAGQKPGSFGRLGAVGRESGSCGPSSEVEREPGSFGRLGGAEPESGSFGQLGEVGREAGSLREPGEAGRESGSFGQPGELERESRSCGPSGEAERESHSFGQGAPGFHVTGGDRQFSAVRGAVAGLLAVVARPHHCVLLGALAGVPADAALAAAYLAVSGPASASVRLLGLDPLRVNAVVAAFGPDIAAVADAAVAAAALDPAYLPAPGSPGLDVLAEEHDRHHREEVRLFAS